MPRTITTIDEQQGYFSGVVGRAAHHVGPVADISLAVAGAVIWRNRGDIKVYERDGNMTNALWVEIGAKQFAISCRHEVQPIEIRESTMQGAVSAAFDNSNSAANVRQFFTSL